MADVSSKHADRDIMAATIKGLTLDEYRNAKTGRSGADPDDEFARWRERFLHELESEFGPLPDDEDESGLNEYIRGMKRQFRLRLR